jgi:hypothetical protein
VGVVRNGDEKIITATIMEENADPVVVLRANSYNIGEIDFFKRRF